MQPMRTLLLTTCALWALQPFAAAALPSGGVAAVGLPAVESGWSVEQDLQVAQGGCMTLNQAVEQVKRQYRNGRIISAETKRKGNREVHNIKVLTGDGKVKTVTVQGCNLSSRG